MGNLLVGDNNRVLLLVPRSGSHSLAAAWLEEKEPQNYIKWLNQPGNAPHPAAHLEIQAYSHQGEYSDFCCVVRNPIERFRSMVAHEPSLNLEEHLQHPVYKPIPNKELCTKFFLFETQLQECAEYLGLTNPLPHLSKSENSDKPVLSPDQEARVREIYSEDMALWESLMRLR